MPQIIIKLGDNVVQNFTFDKSILNIGRSRDNDIVLDNLAVSRNHSRLRVIDGKFILTDLNSANGTYVNGVRVTKTEVMDEDVISIGKHKLIFKYDEVEQEEEIGDAFTADRTVIVENSAEGVLTVTKGKNRGEKYKLTKYETSVGRAAENDIVLNDWFVSKVHAKIIKQGNTYALKDLGSWKGSFVNDKMIKEPATLKENDEVRFGSTKMVFTLLDENKMLQIEGRRPQELGYDANASAMPQFVPTGDAAAAAPAAAPRAASAARGATEPAIARPAAAAAAAPTPEPEPEEPPAKPTRMADYGMGAGAGEEPLEFDFESLPEPTSARSSSPDLRAVDGSPAAARATPAPIPPRPAAAPEPAGSVDRTAFIPGGFVSAPPPMMPMASDRAAGGTEPTGAFNFGVGSAFPVVGGGGGGRALPPADVPPSVTPMRPGVAWQEFPDDAPRAPEPAPAPAAKAPAAAAPAPAPAPPREAVAEPASDDPAHLVAVWEKALANKSPIIRKQAAKMLKKLTGKDYEIPQ